MARQAQTQPGTERDAWKSIDRVLIRHLERLIGSRHGIGGLPLNSETLACLIVAMEREKEIQTAAPPVPEHFTPEALQHELTALGFTLMQDIGPLTRDMVAKGYFNLDDEGRLVPQKPASSMIRFFDRILPRMSGLNLIAYFIQTIDEVITERKSLSDALFQFDQTLQMQGVSIRAEASATKYSKATSPLSESKKQTSQTTLARQSKTRVSQADARKSISGYNLLKSEKKPDATSSSAAKSKILSPNAHSHPGKIHKVHFGKPISDSPASTVANAEAEPETESPPRVETKPEPRQSNTSLEKRNEVPVEKQSQTPLEKPGQEPPFDTAPAAADVPATAPPLPEEEPPQVKTHAALDTIIAEASFDIDLFKAPTNVPEAEDENDISLGLGGVDHTDDDIAKRISLFEEDLALECPVCRHSRVKIQETASGKKYYKCSDQTCSFISWGKPHHLQCPRCSNPFLIEARNRDGITVLKCPRANCRHRQDPSEKKIVSSQAGLNSETAANKNGSSSPRKPRKRIVRRKRVRRKK